VALVVSSIHRPSDQPPSAQIVDGQNRTNGFTIPTNPFSKDRHVDGLPNVVEPACLSTTVLANVRPPDRDERFHFHALHDYFKLTPNG
jgi:hypothetical protein